MSLSRKETKLSLYSGVTLVKQAKKTMQKTSLEEIEESIDLLTSYRNRLKNEITNISQKLRIPSKKIEMSLKENPELREIDETLKQLKQQINNIN